MKGFEIKRFSRTNSTNLSAKEFPVGTVVIADSQTKGKGRFKRSWSSGKGGVYMSLVLKPTDKPQFYTFIGCLSVLKAIKKVVDVDLMIKWPNDVYHGKKKLCGILTEVDDKAIVGVGVNVNNEVSNSLKSEAISLKNIINKKVDKEKTIKNILKHFHDYLELIENKKYSKILSDWKKYSFLGAKVKVKTMNKEFSGIAYDLDKDGFLIVKSGNKKIKVLEGDVILDFS